MRPRTSALEWHAFSSAGWGVVIVIWARSAGKPRGGERWQLPSAAAFNPVHLNAIAVRFQGMTVTEGKPRGGTRTQLPVSATCRPQAAYGPARKVRRQPHSTLGRGHPFHANHQKKPPTNRSPALRNVLSVCYLLNLRRKATNPINAKTIEVGSGIEKVSATQSTAASISISSTPEPSTM